MSNPEAIPTAPADAAPMRPVNTHTPEQIRRNRRIALGVLAVLLVGAGVWAYLANRPEPTRLWLVNGLTAPVTVAVDGRSVELAPMSYQSTPVDKGAHKVVVTSKGQTLATEDIDVPADRRMQLYNVLGAANVTGFNIRYSFIGLNMGDRKFESFAGKTYADTTGSIAYQFVRPPKSLRVKKGSKDLLYRYVGPSLDGRWGWDATLARLKKAGATQAATELEQRIKQAFPEGLPAAPVAPPKRDA